MLVGTALYVHLMVYMGLSLFIIRRALLIYGCMRVYAYNLTLQYKFVHLNIIMSLALPTCIECKLKSLTLRLRMISIFLNTTCTATDFKGVLSLNMKNFSSNDA